MKTLHFLSVTVSLLLLAPIARAQDDFPKPGPEHEKLKQMAGMWEGQIKASFEPGKPAQEGKGEYTSKLDLGGFFLMGEVKSHLAGMPFQGRALTGYDPFKKRYVGVWVDSMSPGIYTTEGSFD